MIVEGNEYFTCCGRCGYLISSGSKTPKILNQIQRPCKIVGETEK